MKKIFLKVTLNLASQLELLNFSLNRFKCDSGENFLYNSKTILSIELKVGMIIELSKKNQHFLVKLH